MATKALAFVREPTYNATLDRYVRRSAITLKTSAAETSSYTTDDGILAEVVQLSLAVTITASSSPTSLIVVIQGSPDGTNWFALGTAATISSGSAYVECAGAKYVRYISTIVGTSFTYSITGTARY